MDPLQLTLLGIGLFVGGLITIGIIFSTLYRKASKEVAFVRTGFGGQRVVMDGGSLVLPVVHETIQVNMNTLRLEVGRSNEAALITKDRLRVDVNAEFFVRVKPTKEAVADAAQTLGKRTQDPKALKELVEGKFVDALRAVAAEMTMEELHEQRVDFVQRVQTTVSEDILKNGLELESVSLTSLDQTSQEYLNPQNAFDAQGLTKLTETIEAKRKQRNDIEQETRIAVQQKNLETERVALELTKEEEYAKLAQEREVSIRRASQASEIKQEQALRQQEARQAEIAAEEQVNLAEIQTRQRVEQERISTEQLVRERDLTRERAVESATIEKQKAVELAEQERAIAIAEKSKAQSEAEAQAALARAKSVAAEEKVITAREQEIAERQKTIELVQAAEEAEREAIKIKVAAEAEKQAALDKSEAVKTLASAEADKIRIAAEGDAEAERLRAAAAAIKYEVDAKGQRELNEAVNLLSEKVLEIRLKEALIAKLPEIIAESVRPMEQIEGIKIIQVDGINGSNSGAGTAAAAGANNGSGGSLADQVVNSALRYRGQAPLIDSLMKEIGLDGADINSLKSAIVEDNKNGTAPKQPTEEPTKDSVETE